MFGHQWPPKWLQIMEQEVTAQMIAWEASFQARRRDDTALPSFLITNDGNSGSPFSLRWMTAEHAGLHLQVGRTHRTPAQYGHGSQAVRRTGEVKSILTWSASRG